MTGVHRGTIIRLGVRMGKDYVDLMDEKMRDLNLGYIEIDELWSFTGAKQKTAKANIVGPERVSDQ